MGLNKDQLIFDPSMSIGTCDEIGSYIISKDGSIINHTTVGGDDGLDVNVINDLTVDADGFFVVVTNDNPDDIGMILFQRGAAPDETDQTFRPTGGLPGSSTVDPLLVHAQDVNSFLMGYDSGNDEWERLESVDGILKVQIDNEPLDVNSFDKGFNTCINVAKSVTDSATDLLATDLVSRAKILIQNLGSNAVFVGCDSSVTVANGIKLSKGSSMEMPFGAGVDVHAITASGTADIRILELAE